MKLIILRGKTGTGKSTLLELIEQNFQYRKVEIDEIKMKKYGTTKVCNPPVDFKEAGLIAKGLLLNGHNVVVEEAFLSQSHIQYLLQDLANVIPTTIYIRLECSEETAITRKSNVLDLATIHSQHIRSIDNVVGEIIFNTDKLTSEDIINGIRDMVN